MTNISMSKNTVFIDTGVWYALADKSDQFHGKSTDYIKRLMQNGVSLVTTNLVIHETVMLLSRKLSKKAAIRFLDMVYLDDTLEIKENDEIIEQKAYKVFKKYHDQDFSITDCVSFTIMKDHHIKKAFTFDRHFKVMKFTVVP